MHIPKVLVHIPGVGENPYDETCRGQFISRRFWFISRVWVWDIFSWPACDDWKPWKTLTMKHVGANSYPEGSGSYPGCGCGTFFRGLNFWGLHRRLQAMKNPYDETCRGQFIFRRFWFISRVWVWDIISWPACDDCKPWKTLTMKHVGANSYPEGSGSYPGRRRRTFFRGLRATTASREEPLRRNTCGPIHPESSGLFIHHFKYLWGISTLYQFMLNIKGTVRHKL